jgi:hypothetical protein
MGKPSGSLLATVSPVFETIVIMKKQLPEMKPASLKEICEREVSEDVGGKYHAARQRFIKLVKSGKISVAEIDRQLQEQIWLLAILADLFQSHPKELGSLTSENQSDAVRSLGSIGRTIVTILDAQAKKRDVDAAEALWDIDRVHFSGPVHELVLGHG